MSKLELHYGSNATIKADAKMIKDHQESNVIELSNFENMSSQNKISRFYFAQIRIMKNLLLILVSLTMSKCYSIKESQKKYVRDPEMELLPRKIENPENNFMIYREGGDR